MARQHTADTRSPGYHLYTTVHHKRQASLTPGRPLAPDYICFRICPAGLLWRGHTKWTALSKDDENHPDLDRARSRGGFQNKARDRQRAAADPETDRDPAPPPTAPHRYNAPQPRWVPARIDPQALAPTADTSNDGAAARPTATGQPPRHTAAEDGASRPTSGPGPLHLLPNPSSPYVITPSTHVLDSNTRPHYNSRQEDMQT